MISQSYSQFPLSSYTEPGPPCKELKGINHKGPPRAEGSRYSTSSSLLFFPLVSLISHYIAARATNKPTNKKTVVWHWLLCEMPVLPWRVVFSDEKTKTEALRTWCCWSIRKRKPSSPPKRHNIWWGSVCVHHLEMEFASKIPSLSACCQVDT